MRGGGHPCIQGLGFSGPDVEKFLKFKEGCFWRGGAGCGIPKTFHPKPKIFLAKNVMKR